MSNENSSEEIPEASKDSTSRTGRDVRGQIRIAVTEGQEIRNEVRAIVTRALSEGKLDRADIRNTLEEAVNGALEAAPETTRPPVDAFKETAHGIEDALATLAEASKLTLEEAQSRVDVFSERDLRRAVEDLRALEVMFAETVADLAKSGTATFRTMLHDFAIHTERTGSDTHASIRAAREAFERALAHSGPPSVPDMARAARSGASTFAAVTSGVLAGLADALAPKSTREAEATIDKADQKED